MKQKTEIFLWSHTTLVKKIKMTSISTKYDNSLFKIICTSKINIIDNEYTKKQVLRKETLFHVKNKNEKMKTKLNKYKQKKKKINIKKKKPKMNIKNIFFYNFFINNISKTFNKYHNIKNIEKKKRKILRKWTAVCRFIYKKIRIIWEHLYIIRKKLFEYWEDDMHRTKNKGTLQTYFNVPHCTYFWNINPITRISLASYYWNISIQSYFHKKPKNKNLKYLQLIYEINGFTIDTVKKKKKKEKKKTKKQTKKEI